MCFLSTKSLFNKLNKYVRNCKVLTQVCYLSFIFLRVVCSLFFCFSPSHLFGLTRLFWEQMQPLSHLQNLASEGFINLFTDPSLRRNRCRSLLHSFILAANSIKTAIKNNYQAFTYLTISPSRLYYFPFLDLLWKYDIKRYQAVNKTLWTISFFTENF